MKKAKKVKPIKVVVCPSCRYEISVKQKNAAIIDYHCPKCRRHKLSEFAERQ